MQSQFAVVNKLRFKKRRQTKSASGASEMENRTGAGGGGDGRKGRENGPDLRLRLFPHVNATHRA